MHQFITMHTASLQHLPPSTLLLIANALAPPTLKHTFRLPEHRTAHCSLLAASLTCHALRSVCFPIAIQVFRSPALRPQAVADLGESVRELEARLDFLLDAIHLWPHVRKLDIEIYARAPQRLVAKLATLLTLPHLSFISLKLPTYRVFRDALVKDLRGVIKAGSGSVRTLCVDACAGWMLAFFPRVCEVVVWSWPSEVDREGGLSPEQTTCGWRTFLAGLSAQAPCVEEVEVGGLSIYDVNELFPSLANYLQHTTTLRILHRKEEFGALPLSHPSAQTIHPRTLSSIYTLWEDTLDDDEYEGQLISGCPGAVRRIVYFDLQEECGACYVPGKRGRMWVDDGPAVVLSLKSLEGRD